MKKRHYSAILILALLAAAVMACAMQRKSTLRDQVTAYHQAYKWKDYSKASVFVEDPDDFLKKMEPLRDRLEVVDYEILRTTVNKDGKEAEVEIVRSYTMLPSVTVERQRIMQQWKFDSKRRNWLLVSPY